MMIHLNEVLPNPLRDFDLDPLDSEKVQTLAASVDDLEFWGGIAVRKLSEPATIPAAQAPHWHTNQGRYQLAFGHHRLQALLASGKYATKADLNILAYDDVSMAKAMGLENATQRKGVAAATDAVGAAIRVLGYNLLSDKGLDDLGLNICWDPNANVSQDAMNSIKGKLLAGSGLGEDLLKTFFDGAISLGDIRAAIATLKGSGKMTEYLEEIQGRIAAEAAEAEAKARALAEEQARKQAAAEAAEKARKKAAEEAKQAAEEARQAKERAKAKADADAEEKARQAAEAAEKANADVKAATTKAKTATASYKRGVAQVDEAIAAGKTKAASAKKAETAVAKAKEKQPVVLDARVASLFTSLPNDVYQEVRKQLTTETVLSYVPVSEQYKVVKDALNWMDEQTAQQQGKKDDASLWTKRRYAKTAENVCRVLNQYIESGRRFIAEIAPAHVKEQDQLARDVKRLEDGIKLLTSGMNALHDKVANGDDIPVQYGTSTFFSSTWPSLQKKMAEFAKAHAEASTIINQ